MNTPAIFTKRILGMDYRVWLVMPALWLLSLALFGYKYINDNPCAAASISVDGKRTERASCYTNKLVRFSIQTEEPASVVWNFDDGTEERSGLEAYHEFKEGTYTVVATVNENCKYEQEVTVEPPAFISPEKKEIVIFEDPRNPKLGSTVTFKSVAINIPVDSYEWTLLNTGDVQNDAVATFTFNDPGNYIVQLIVNNDPRTKRIKEINIAEDTPSVAADPANETANTGSAVNAEALTNLITPGGNSEGPKTGNEMPSNTPKKDSVVKKDSDKANVKDIDPETFKGLLQDVIDENKEIGELYPYLNYQGSTMVEVNGEKPLITLKDFCKSIKNSKKIQSVSFKKDDKNGIWIKVKVKRSWFDRINFFD